MGSPSEVEVKAVLQDWRQTLMRLPGVSAVGRGGGSPQKIIVYVERVTAEVLRAIPQSLEGVQVEVRESGIIRMLSLMQVPVLLERTMRIRPLVGGISLGCPQGPTGTFSSRVLDARTGAILGLSNTHVLLGASWGEQEGYEKNPVWQPGKVDGGESEDTVGYTLRGVPVLLPPAENLIDGNVFTPISPDVLSPEVLEIGVPGSATEVSPGIMLWKSGRTSGLTSSIVSVVDATVDVSGWGTCRFIDQIIVEPKMADPGDSGSLVVTEDGRVAGLVHAGSDRLTCLCKASHVQSLLGIRFAAVPYVAPAVFPSLTFLAGFFVVGAVLYSGMKPKV